MLRLNLTARVLVPILLLLFLLPPLSAQEEFTEYAGLLSRYDRYELFRREITAIEQRRENLPGAQAVLDLLLQYAQERSIDTQLYDIEKRGDFHSFGKNLRFNISGRGEGLLVFFLPYIDTAETDSAALLAALLSIFDTARPSSRIEINFLGSMDENKGILEYLDRIEYSTPDLLFFLTGHETLGDLVRQKSGGGGIMTPLWSVRHVEELLRKQGLPRGIYNSQFYRLGLLSASNITPLLEAELNALHLEILPASNEAPPGRRALDFLSDLVLNTEVPQNDPALQDRHYLNIIPGSSLSFLVENQYVIGVLMSIFVLIVILISQKHHIQLFTINTIKEIALFVYLAAAMLLSILFGDLLAQLLEAIRGIENLDKYISVLIFLLKFAAGALLFFGLAYLPHYFFPTTDIVARENNFHPRAAIIMFGLNLIIFITININFSHYFLWAILMAILSTASSARWFRSFCLLISPLPLLFILADHILTLSALPSLPPTIQTTLLLFCILLPFAFMAMGIGKKTMLSRRSWLVMRLAAFSTIFIIALTIDPFTTRQPQQITIDISNTQRVPVSTLNNIISNPDKAVRRFDILAYSDAPLGNLDIGTPDFFLSTDSRKRRHEFPPQTLPAEMTYVFRKEDLLWRSSYKIELRSNVHNPESISIQLNTGEITTIYSSNLPYKQLTPLGNIQFLTGLNPPNPLVLEFVLPAETELRLDIEALYYPDGDALSSGNVRQLTLLRREKIIFEAGQQQTRGNSGDENL